MLRTTSYSPGTVAAMLSLPVFHWSVCFERDSRTYLKGIVPNGVMNLADAVVPTIEPDGKSTVRLPNESDRSSLVGLKRLPERRSALNNSKPIHPSLPSTPKVSFCLVSQKLTGTMLMSPPVVGRITKWNPRVSTSPVEESVAVNNVSYSPTLVGVPVSCPLVVS